MTQAMQRKLCRTDVPEVDRQRVRNDLDEYCGLDTDGMIWIVRELSKLT